MTKVHAYDDRADHMRECFQCWREHVALQVVRHALWNCYAAGCDAAVVDFLVSEVLMQITDAAMGKAMATAPYDPTRPN